MFVQRNLLRLAAHARSWIGLGVLLGLLVTATRVAQALLLARVVVDVISGASFSDLAALFAWIAVAIAVRAVLLWVAEVASARTAHATKRRMRELLYTRLFDLGPGYLARERTGEVRSALVDGVEELESYNARYLPALLQVLLAPAAVAAYLFTVHAGLAVIALLGAAFSILVPTAFLRWYGRRSEAVWTEIGRFDAEFVDTVQGLPTLKAFGASQRRGAYLGDLAERVRKVVMAQLRIGLLNGALQKLGTLGGAAAVFVAAASGFSAGTLEPYAAILVVFLVGELFRPLDDLGRHTHAAIGAIGAADRIQRLLDAENPTPPPTEPVPVGDEDVAVVFDDVTFTYPGRSTPAVSHVSFAVRPGSRLAVVGPSGSGKTTLVSLLLRFVDVSSGAVLVGGRDVRELAPERLRELVAVVSQDTYLFHGTIADNIALGRPGATPADVRRAAEAAGVADFVEALPHGYDTHVGERGLQVSGGQRQRIAIARAVLKDAPVLVLDEATSAVDAASEAGIAAALDAVSRGRTTITIAHRLSTVRDADEIVVLADGVVAERGTHDSLRHGRGLYADLLAAQPTR